MMFMRLAVCYLVLINLLGFVLMGWDKRRAKKEAWRVPERRFFLVALMGGSIGCWLGMQKFRHKTKHTAFVVGIPAILLFQIAFFLWLYGRYVWQ